ncbi:MAG: cytochrome c oxidase subunit II [Candidatus Baltobacteraceae bacterium]
MTDVAAPKPQEVPTKGLGPGFWPFAIALTVLNVAVALLIYYAPLDFFLPGESNEVADRAADIDALFKFMSAFGFAIFTYVAGFVIYFAIVFRRRRGEPRETIGVQIHDSPTLELWWTIVPVLIIVALIWMSINVWAKVQFGNGSPALTMEVIGHQFYFEYRYPGLKSSVYSNGEAMHLPLGEPVRVLVTSADVLHSFWVPEIRLKATAVPGLVQNVNFTPTRTGSFQIVCAEFCGVDHSVMQGQLIIESPAAFRKWFAGEQTKAVSAAPVSLAGGDAAAGKAVFTQKCAACHAIAPFEQKIVGPGLAKLTDDPKHPTLVDGKPPTPDDIGEILENGYTGPLGAMPNRQATGISDKDIADLVAYLSSLK